VIQVGGAPREVVTAPVLDRMTDVLTHRGPDDRGTYLEPGAALGVRRLSIVDVEGGHQPFANERGDVWAVQNGELYNHLDLRSLLAGHGHRFRSRCDTEVLPHLYEHAGSGFPKHLRGKFGLAVWDARERRAVLARDRLGVKPLYYAQSGDLLVFGSELKSVLASGLVDTTLDYEALDAYLTFGFVPAPRTPLAAVSKLLPGHLLVVDSDGVRVERYWAYPPPAPDVPPLSEQEYADGLLERLEESVRSRLMSDVPLGAMLSGGLDSSLIVALMARNMGEPVKTFSIGFAEDDANELADARYVADLFSTDHHELELSYTDDTVDLEDLVWHLDEPLAELSALGFYALSQLASNHVTVALSGQGADELVAGYERYRSAAVAQRWRRLPRSLRLVGEALLARGPYRLRRLGRIVSAGTDVDRILALHAQSEPLVLEARGAGVPTGVRLERARDLVSSRLAGYSGASLPALLYLDAQLSLVDDMLHYFDRASMAHSLEVRVPFLDHELVEYCARIPDDLKVKGLTTKHILKRAAHGILPERIVKRRKIGFFNSAVPGWFRADANRAMTDYLLQERPVYERFVERSHVERLIASHRNGDRPSYSETRLLLSLLVLEIWLASCLPRLSAGGPRFRAPVPARA
jgi:asparagine synthase (glutamine-hydrolysing)